MSVRFAATEEVLIFRPRREVAWKILFKQVLRQAMSKRRHARERVLQALYAHALGGGSPEHIIRTVIEPRMENDSVTFGFARDLFLQCLDREKEASKIISDHVQNWDLSRVAIIDRLVIQMAIVEFLYLEDVPPKVTMNELIEIAKKYSTLESGKFVNGVLDAVLDSLMRADRIHKKGRGLVGMEESKKPEKVTG